MIEIKKENEQEQNEWNTWKSREVIWEKWDYKKKESN